MTQHIEGARAGVIEALGGLNAKPERCDLTSDLFALKGNAANQTRSIDWHADLDFVRRHARAFLLFGAEAADVAIARAKGIAPEPFTDIGRWCAINKRFELVRLGADECAIEFAPLMWAEIPVPL